MLAPARAFPFAVAASSASLFFTRPDLSAAAPIACLPLPATLGLGVSHLSAASLARGFALLSASGLGFGCTRPSLKNPFRVEIMPGNALARAFIPRGPLDLAFIFFVDTCFRHTCLMFVLLTLIYPRSFYFSEYEIPTAVCLFPDSATKLRESPFWDQGQRDTKDVIGHFNSATIKGEGSGHWT